jgi:hypothetical protein
MTSNCKANANKQPKVASLNSPSINQQKIKIKQKPKQFATIMQFS